MLPSERRDIQYLVAGRGPDLPALRDLAKELGVEGQVRWLGFLPESMLPGLYRASNLFVMCTRESPEAREVEGFGLVFLEAQACGTPVIGTHAGGIPDAVEDGRGGWLIAQDDVQALTRHLRHLVRAPQDYAEAGRVARTRVERAHTWKHYESPFVSALRDVGFQI